MFVCKQYNNFTMDGPGAMVTPDRLLIVDLTPFVSIQLELNRRDDAPQPSSAACSGSDINAFDGESPCSRIVAPTLIIENSPCGSINTKSSDLARPFSPGPNRISRSPS